MSAAFLHNKCYQFSTSIACSQDLHIITLHISHEDLIKLKQCTDNSKPSVPTSNAESNLERSVKHFKVRKLQRRAYVQHITCPVTWLSHPGSPWHFRNFLKDDNIVLATFGNRYRLYVVKLATTRSSCKVLTYWHKILETHNFFTFHAAQASHRIKAASTYLNGSK